MVINNTKSHESKAFGDVNNTTHSPDDVRLAKYHPDIPDIRKNYAHYHDQVKKMDADIGAGSGRFGKERPGREHDRGPQLGPRRSDAAEQAIPVRQRHALSADHSDSGKVQATAARRAGQQDRHSGQLHRHDEDLAESLRCRNARLPARQNLSRSEHRTARLSRQFPRPHG